VIVYIYVDESGSLSDPYDAVVTMVAIRTETPEPLRWIIKRVKRRVRWQRPKRAVLPEFKFHNTTDRARAAVLSALAKEDVALFAFSVFKGHQSIPDTPENYGIVLCSLLEMCIGHGEKVELIINHHFNIVKQQEELTALIRSVLGSQVMLRYVDSRRNPFVQLADFVAGAVHYRRTGRSEVFYELIRERIVGDQLLLWKDLKREWYRQKREGEETFVEGRIKKWQIPGGPV